MGEAPVRHVRDPRVEGDALKHAPTWESRMESLAEPEKAAGKTARRLTAHEKLVLRGRERDDGEAALADQG
jgi:hypothetical protein